MLCMIKRIEIHCNSREREESKLKMNQLTESVNHTITRLPTALPVVVIEAIPSDRKYSNHISLDYSVIITHKL